jgi:mono/diheme cytochrome c family protein
MLLQAANAWAADDVTKRGEYLARTGLCFSCHTDSENKGKMLAGGRSIKTPFGTVYSTNITPDPDTGIGIWTDADFLRAMREGVRRDGENLYPTFPYTTYTHMTDRDILALKAYLFSVKPVRQKNRPAAMGAPFRWRFLLSGWKWKYLKEGVFQPEPARSKKWNRGAYLVNAVAHCGECHTPRDITGGLNEHMAMAGTPDGPEGELAPNITPDPTTGIADWTVDDMVTLLKEGIKPDADNVQGLMEEIIEHGYKYMTDEDLESVAVYLRTIKPIQNTVESE